MLRMKVSIIDCVDVSKKHQQVIYLSRQKVATRATENMSWFEGGGMWVVGCALCTLYEVLR